MQRHELLIENLKHWQKKKMGKEEINEKLLQKDSSVGKRVWKESKKMWVVAGPAIMSRFSTFGITVVSQSFIGHIGSTDLAAYALVMTLLVKFANGVLLGMASALETLCGQAYGAKKYEMLGIYLQRSWIILFMTSLLLLPIFIFTAPLLKFLGQEKTIAEGQLVYIMRNCPQTWKGFSFLAFKDLRPLVKLSLSSGAMILNINGWEMVIALGFFAAAGVRVANELGRGSSEGAKFSIVVTAVTSFCIGIVLFFVFLLLRERVAYVFTPNPMVAEAVGELSPLLAFSIFLNSLQPVLSGVSVGAGWQSVVAYVNIGCYYLIGIPVGVLLGNFLHLKIKGIWIGMLFGTVVQTIMLITITMKTDWDKQVEIARNRVNKWTIIEENEEPCNSNEFLVTDGFCPSVKASLKIIYRQIFFRRKITDEFLPVTDGFSLCKFSIHFPKATNFSTDFSSTDFSSVITDGFFDGFSVYNLNLGKSSHTMIK
ncbi:hypothetical protein Ahy_A06g028928 [Arachis hypogaea]|uniref:Protein DETOXIFICATION n=1 Tax=Arachis hypogaea TaxID=3818 RepID=A0A445CRZ6_ARAHY|nr:hypothetical protein Ahy_A06g028928 [Arachis hypogaea]